MAEGAMYFLPPGIELAKRRQEEAKKRRGGLMELIARGVMAPGNILQQEITNLPQSVGGAAAQAPEVLEALRGLDTLISGYEVSEPQTPLAGPFPGEEGFMGPMNQRAQAPDPAPGDLNFMGPVGQPGATPSRRGRFAGLADIPPGGFTPPGQDRMDRIVSAAEQSDEGETNRMLLALAEGLTRAGAEASNVRSISDILAGQARRPTQSLSADMLAKVRELSEQRDTKRLEDAKNPVVDLINKEYGTSFKTPDEAREFMSLRKTQADIEETKGQTAARNRALDIKEQADQQAGVKAEAEKSKALYDARTEFRKLPMFRAQEDALTKVERVLAALETDNPSVIQTEAIAMARAAGEVGNLSQEERYVFVRFPGLEGWLNSVQEFATSQPTEKNKERLRDLAMTYKRHATKAMNDLVSREIDSYTSSHADADPKAVKEQFTSLIPRISSAAEEEAAPEGKRWVVITKAFGENEVGDKKLIDEEDYESGREVWD